MEMIHKYGPIIAKALMTVAFGAAGTFKLIGAPDMVAVFDTIGWGQWFRYVTGIVEVGSVILLWVPGMAFIGAGLLLCTMICAVLFHLLLLGPSAVPALILGLLSAYVLYDARKKMA